MGEFDAPTVGDLIKVMEKVGAENPDLANDYLSQAIIAVMLMQGGECHEGPLTYMAWSLKSVIAYALELGADGDTVRSAVARTIKQTLPIPPDVYDAMVDTYAELSEQSSEDEVIAAMEKQFREER